jgi:hypothetical protein
MPIGDPCCMPVLARLFRVTAGCPGTITQVLALFRSDTVEAAIQRHRVSRRRGSAPGADGAAGRSSGCGPPRPFLLFSQAESSLAAKLADLILQLDPEPDDKRRALDTLLAMLPESAAPGTTAADMAVMVAHLDPTSQDIRQARDALLALLAGTEGWAVDRLAADLAQLGPTHDDKRRALDAVLSQLSSQTLGVTAEAVAAALTRFDATADDRRKAREALLGQLSGRRHGTVRAGERCPSAHSRTTRQAPGP